MEYDRDVDALLQWTAASVEVSLAASIDVEQRLHELYERAGLPVPPHADVPAATRPAIIPQPRLA